jgi:hypothetical protein
VYFIPNDSVLVGYLWVGLNSSQGEHLFGHLDVSANIGLGQKWQLRKNTQVKAQRRHNFVKEKTSFQNKSKLITENYYVQHLNITTNKSLFK